MSYVEKFSLKILHEIIRATLYNYNVALKNASSGGGE